MYFEKGKTGYMIGDIITFGAYWQDRNAADGKKPIEWIVLDVNADGSLVLLSKYALDGKPYNTIDYAVTWKTCTLRKWLNGDFCNAAFSAEEQARMKYTNIVNKAHPEYDTEGGKDTFERLWLLSINEVTDYFRKDQCYEYFTDNSSRICAPTAYAEAQGVYAYDGYCWWWLRSPGCDSWCASYVNRVGIVNDYGYDVYCGTSGVRPAMIVLP